MRINVTLPSSALSVDAVLSTLRRSPPPSPPRHLAANVPFATANFAVPVTTTFLPNGKVDTRLLDTVASSHLRPPSFLGAPPPAFYDSLRYQQKPPFPRNIIPPTFSIRLSSKPFNPRLDRVWKSIRVTISRSISFFEQKRWYAETVCTRQFVIL